MAALGLGYLAEVPRTAQVWTARPERQVKKAYLAPFHDSYHFAADYAVMEPHRTWTTYQGPDNAEKFLENSYYYPADLRTSPVQASFMWLDMATGKTTHVEHTFHPDEPDEKLPEAPLSPGLL